jgi:hypothetical protein
MEVAAAFLLLVVAIVVLVLGGGVWLLASTLRRRKLSPGEDKLDRHMVGTEPRGERRQRDRGRQRDEDRPEHHRVTNEQGSRSIPHG